VQRFLKVYVFLFGVPEVGFQLRARYVQGIVKRFKFTSALDAGCGIGLNACFLAKRNPKAAVDACDIVPNLVTMAKLISDDSKLANMNVFQLDLSKLSDVDKYDLIYCVDVIEHIPDDEIVLANFFRAMKKGGILVMSTPHKRHVKRFIKGLQYDGSGHVREGYVETEFNDLLVRSGFEIQTVRHVWGFFGEYCEEAYAWSLRHLPAPFAALSFPFLSVASSLDMLSKNTSGYGLIVIATKK